MGKLIVIEGSDGCGKSTQFNILKQNLENLLPKFKAINFPRYNNESSYFIKKYLQGHFGKNPTDVNAFASATFFSLDRFAAFNEDFGENYKDGYVILSDRYTTSNAVHQASKIDNKDEYLEWLFDFEYNKLGIPEPDLVVFLDMPPKYSKKLLMDRLNQPLDIHELDDGYLKNCYDISLEICDKYNWKKISCIKDSQIRSIEDISWEILEVIKTEIMVK